MLPLGRLLVKSWPQERCAMCVACDCEVWNRPEAGRNVRSRRQHGIRSPSKAPCRSTATHVALRSKNGGRQYRGDHVAFRKIQEIVVAKGEYPVLQIEVAALDDAQTVQQPYGAIKLSPWHIGHDGSVNAFYVTGSPNRFVVSSKSVGLLFSSRIFSYPQMRLRRYRWIGP